MLGKIRRNRENIIAQLNCYYLAIKNGYDSLNIRHKIAKINLELGNNKQAAEDFRKILEMDENCEIALNELYRLYTIFQDNENIGQICLKLGKKLKENLNVGIGVNSHDQESPINTCLMYYTKAYNSMPENLDVIIGLADLYRILNRHKEALHYINQALKINNRDYYVYYIAFLIYDDIGDSHTAKELIKTSLLLNMNFIKGYNAFGNLLRKEKLYQEASRIFETALIHEEDNILILNNYGNCLLEMGNKKKAKDMFLKAYHLDNNLVELNSNLATIYRKECIYSINSR